MKKILVIGLILVFGIWFWQKQGSEPKLSEQVGEIAQVSVASVEVAQNGVGSEVGATVQATGEAVLSAQIGGMIKMKVSAGERVRAGQVLAQIEAPEFGAGYAQAEAGLRQAEAVERNARRHWHDLSPDERESIKSASALARAQVAEANAYRQKTIIRAPFGGLVIEVMAENGETVLPGMPMLRLGVNRQGELKLAIVQEIAQNLQVGDQVKVSNSQKRVMAEVKEVAPTADAVTQKTIVKLAVGNEFGLGEYVVVHFMKPTSMAVEVKQVPIAAVLRQYDDSFVFVVGEDDKLRQIRVEVLSARDGFAQITGDVQVGDRAVTGDLRKLREGMAVKIVNN